MEQIPPPPTAQAIRIPTLLHPELPLTKEPVPPSNRLERDLYSCNTSKDAIVVAYVSKLFAVPTSRLPHHQRRALTANEMRESGRKSREAAAALRAAGVTPTEPPKATPPSTINMLSSTDGLETLSKETESNDHKDVVTEAQETLIGFARLYSGTLHVGQRVYCILPKFNAGLLPSHTQNAPHWTTATIERLYMLMGQELVSVDVVPAGNVFGVCGLQGKVLR